MVAKQKLSPEAIASVEEDLAIYIDARNRRDSAEADRSAAGKRIVETLQRAGLDSYIGKVGKATVSAKTTHVLNEDKFRRRIGVQMWNKITTRVLDKAKLDAFIKSKEIKVADVAACTTSTEGDPYATVTAK